MSGPFGSDQWMYSSGGYEIDQSLRFNDDDSAYLSRTPASAGNQKTWTWSGWVKRGNLSTGAGYYGTLFGVLTGPTETIIEYQQDDKIEVRWYSGGYAMQVRSAPIYRDTSSWYHVVVAIDTTQSTASNRAKLYVNGEQVTELTTATYPAQNSDLDVNNSIVHSIGMRSDVVRAFDGYLAEVNFIDGQALDPSYFGETDADYGHWKPIKYTGTYGTNGFYLDFGNSSSLGEDQSGNSNDWTANNLAATDVVLDSPTNNFATLNPLWSTSGTLSEGNLKNVTPASGRGTRSSTISAASGKYYCEIYCQTLTYYARIGVIRADTTYSETDTFTNTGYNGIGYLSVAGDVQSNGLTVSTGGASYTTGDIIGVALDLDNNEVSFYKNGTQEYSALNPSSLLDSGDWMFVLSDSSNSGGSTFVANFGQDSSFAGNKTAQGNTDANGIGDFYYAPPSGYLALCTQNLPEPTVAPADHFNTVLWSAQSPYEGISVTGVGFQPDLVWSKIRTQTWLHNLYDVLRGTGNAAELSSNTTNAEGAADHESHDYLSSFDSDGFSSTWSGSNFASYFNQSGQTYVAWNWKANGSGVSNTDGTITSTVSANQDAGFSIVSYTGNGTGGATIGHGLSSAPEMVIVKVRDAANNWPVYHVSTGNSNYTMLNSTNASAADGGGFWNTTSPSSTVVTLGSAGAVNLNAGSFIAYCFHSVDGFSKVGSYTGNGSTDGPFVYTGFRPAFVMIKYTSKTGYWWMYDNKRAYYNAVGPYVFANENWTEGTYPRLDFLSNGFKHRYSGNPNESGQTAIYIAFAENPFKYANAR